jgi:glycosyltransferase involved in cell wall biosynthesis
MAGGTPVIAFDRGSMRELIDDGTTGSLVSDVDEAARAVSSITRLDRSVIRATAVERFAVDRMVDDYIALYNRVVQHAGAV